MTLVAKEMFMQALLVVKYTQAMFVLVVKMVANQPVVAPEILNAQVGRIKPPTCEKIKLTPLPTTDKYMEWRKATFNKTASASKRVKAC